MAKCTFDFGTYEVCIYTSIYEPECTRVHSSSITLMAMRQTEENA